MSNATEEHSHYGARIYLFVFGLLVGIAGLVLDGINCGLVNQRVFGCNNIGEQLFGEAASQVISQIGTIIMFVVSFMIPSKAS